MQDKAKRVGRMSGYAGALPEFKVVVDARSHHLSGAQIWLGSSWNLSVFLGRPLHRTP